MTVIKVSNKNNNNGKDSFVEDPLDELNEIEDKTVTIERENDVFEELEIRDAESIPEYNPESGAFIKTSEGLEKVVNDELSDGININLDDSSNNDEDSDDAGKIMDVIDEVDVNNPENEDKIDTKRDVQESIKASQESEIRAKKSEKLSQLAYENSHKESPDEESSNKPNSFKVNESDEIVIKNDGKKAPKIRFKPHPPSKNNKSNTKVVDNVKVDEDGVPLLNQFDTDKIKTTSFYHKLHLNKRNLTQMALILIGFLIIIYGIIQSFEEVAKISDNVMYGEHASFSIAIIFLGILIIILAFYKEIINLFGLGNMYNTLDSNDSDDFYDNNKKD